MPKSKAEPKLTPNAAAKLANDAEVRKSIKPKKKKTASKSAPAKAIATAQKDGASSPRNLVKKNIKTSAKTKNRTSPKALETPFETNENNLVRQAELVEPEHAFKPGGEDADFPGDPYMDLPDAAEVADLTELAKLENASSPALLPATGATSKALATPDPVATYLAEIRRYSLLTREQEQELAVRYRETGDPTAAEALVTSNLRFVVKIAAEYSRFGAKLIDLIQEGNVGLMHAVKEFNPYKGVRLITYAVWWIRGYIQEYLMRQYSMVRIGTTQNQRKLFYKLQKEKQLMDSQGQAADYKLLSSRLGVTEEEVETMTKRLSGRDISLSQTIDGSGESTATLLDFESTGETGVDEQIGNQEELDVLNQNIEKMRPSLSEKETYILEHRVLADEPETLQEIGEHFGVTREAVRQLEARLIGKIGKAVTSSLHHDGQDS